MKFIDEATIHVQAGHGGSGCKHFHREKFVPLGGPDGGNGGKGGSVILLADPSKTTLLDFKFRPRWNAENGTPGGKNGCDGRAGEDLVIKLPVGTQVFREGSDELIVDLSEANREQVLAKGGRGGKGNAFFKSSTNQAPEHFQPGEEGEIGTYRLSLKLVADVGLIGFPNAGKSTLISRISSARPKIADYPFTTLVPNLGVVKARDGFSFVVADIPGLIPGAHQGKGLGINFLKHVERTRVLAHLIDPNQLDDHGQKVSALDAYNTINEELKLFSAELANKPQIVVITKLDSVTDHTELEKTLVQLRRVAKDVLCISSASGQGLQELMDILAKHLH